MNERNISKKIRIWNIILTIFFTGILAVFIYFLVYPDRVPENQIINSKSNGTFKIRIVEESIFFMQFRYSIQTAKENSDYWKTVYSVTHDDLHPSRVLPVDFIGKKIGYFAFGEIYAVTKDRGESWRLFDFSKQTNWGRDNGYYALIEDVKMNEKGVGIIYLRKSKPSEDLPKFITDDFGFAWKEG